MKIPVACSGKYCKEVANKMNNLHVKTGDTAVVLSGKGKGQARQGLSVKPEEGVW